MLQGWGDTTAETLNLAGGATAQRLIQLFLFEFTFTSEAEALEALGFQAGTQKIQSSAEGAITDTVTLSTQLVDWAQLGFFTDEFPKTLSSVSIPTLNYATVPATSPYEVANAAITTGNISSIKAYISRFGTWGQPGHLTHTTNASTAPANGNEVQVDTTNNKLIFSSSRAGSPVVYYTPVAYASIQAYGGAGTATKYGKISFRGKLFSPESTANWGVYFPSLSRKTRPNLEITGDVPTLSVDFSAETPSGWEKPYEIYNLDTKVLA